ncbi:hypothetical protein [Streptomyces sp. NBC_00239]|uniref:hypothetical protein n=1 Tax=Streptomyces sp. NBC_00239 TaxID=2903640 RepID=UPI002E2AD8A5|nr:hypothetical protein [Streptomyces sp. NBC_00239]
MFRLPRLLILLVTSLVCVGALSTGCKHGSGTETAKWLTSFDDVFTRGKTLADTFRPGELTELGVQKTTLDELLSAAPKNRPEEVVAAVVRGEALANQMDVLRRGSTLEADAAAVTNAAVISQGSTDATTWSQLLTDMKKAAAEVIEDVACGEAWSMLSNSQKQRIGVPTESHDHVDGALEAIEGKAQSILAERWIVNSLNTAINWANYAVGIQEKASEIEGYLKGGHFTSEDTRAYYYYARFCLKPPG